MLGRGEQRALVFLALILMFSLVIRVTVRFLPGKEPPGMDEFIRENREIIAAYEHRDSLEKWRCQDPETDPDTAHLQRNRKKKRDSWRWRADPVDINRADSLQLLPLPGIGPVFSGRIIKYRNLLGGYAALHQLEEVYGLDKETIEKISASILFDTAAIRRLDVNGASFSDLLRHPYLDYDDVKSLLNYREFKGRIGSVKEIRGNNLLHDSTLERVIPYMDFDH